MDKILLIDALNSIYRAKVAFKKPKDAAYTVVFNFFRQLRALIEEFQPDKVFFCNEGRSGFRYKLYADYKSNRIIKNAAKDKKITEDFDNQRKIILDLLHYLPIIQVKADQFEADDVINSLAFNMRDEDIIVVSNDKDYIQLLQRGLQHIQIYNPFKKEFMVSPDYHFLSFLTLAGDTSDNVPRIVNDAIAVKLASNPDAMIEFLSHEENRASYALNKQLVEFRIINDDELRFEDYEVNYDVLREEFHKMNMPTMIEEAYWKTFCQTFNGLR